MGMHVSGTSTSIPPTISTNRSTSHHTGMTLSHQHCLDYINIVSGLSVFRRVYMPPQFSIKMLSRPLSTWTMQIMKLKSEQCILDMNVCKIDRLVNNDHAPFMLTAPMFQVDLFKSNTAGAFSFKIIWSKCLFPEKKREMRKFLDPKADKKSVTLKKGGLPIAGIPDPYLTTYQAETYVSFVAFGLKNESRNALLRQSAVYDGNSTSGLFMGNLFKLMMEGKEVITRGSTLTVYTFGLYEEFNYTLFMVQDHSSKQTSDFM